MNTMSRRAVLASMGSGAAALALSGIAPVARAGAATSGATADTLPLPAGADALGGGTFQLFGETDLNFQTLFALGEAGQNSCAGEVVAVVAQANAAPGGPDYQVLFDTFVAQANRLHDSAVAAQKARHVVTARSRFIRAAKYYAQALYWVLGTSNPGGEADAYTAMNDMFTAGMKLMEPRPEQIEIRYEGGTLPAWFMSPSAGSTRRPTIIMNNGSDGQNVDMLAQGGFAALDRGYNVLIFEGPGQGSQLFLHNVPFIPEWEKVITPIVDYLESRSDVNTKQIALRGISFGGELTPRAAAYEHRIGALIADPGSIRSWDNYPAVINAVSMGTPEQVNAAWAATIVAGSTPQEKFNLMKSMGIFSKDAHDAAKRGELVTDFAALADTIKRYDNADVLAKIKSPMMVTQYEGDTFFLDAPREMFAKIAMKQKKFVEFTSVDGAQYHCGPMAPQVTNEACWDWVDEVFGR